MKFLIDECLTPTLADLAIAHGHWGSAHVAHRGMAMWADHNLMIRIIENDWTLVTQNADDFRPGPGSNSRAACFLKYPLHAGLVCLNMPVDSTRVDQQMYFLKALAYIGNPGDLVSKALEVDPVIDNPAEVLLREYDFPGGEI